VEENERTAFDIRREEQVATVASLFKRQAHTNHWHLVVKPHDDGELSQFVGWLTLTRTQRWHAFRNNAGAGHFYQGRFKSFPVQDEVYYFTDCRYVKRNALRAKLVQKAEDWRWGRLWYWNSKTPEPQSWLADWPTGRGWLEYVMRPNRMPNWRIDVELGDAPSVMSIGATKWLNSWDSKRAYPSRSTRTSQISNHSAPDTSLTAFPAPNRSRRNSREENFLRSFIWGAGQPFRESTARVSG
jgi:REP element-mobilizing transposase RayT